jgi:hypothetical protein
MLFFVGLLQVQTVTVVAFFEILLTQGIAVGIFVVPAIAVYVNGCVYGLTG